METYAFVTWGRVAPGKHPYDYLQTTLTAYGKTATWQQQTKIFDEYLAAIKSAMPAHWHIGGNWDSVGITYNADRPMTGKEYDKATAFLRKLISQIDIRYFIEKHTRTV